VFVTVHGNDFLRPYHPVGRIQFGVSDRFDRWFGDLLTGRLVRRSLPRARHVFTNSRFTQKVFLERFPDCRGKTSIASVGVDENDFTPHKPLEANVATKLISVCRLDERRKNVSAVLMALAGLRDRYDFHYTIVGDGELRSELEMLCRNMRLTDRVTFEGYVDRKRRTELLRESDLFVMPAAELASSYEGFGIVYLEANACGTPVLAARVGGAVEAVEEGVSGYFVEEPKEADIASALQRFFNREIAFDAEACTRFARRFSWSTVTEHCMAHYAVALGGIKSGAEADPAEGTS
jgi:glycosyltransferase involved in cell wall biosynthesis